MSNVYVEGEIQAITGSIGGWRIDEEGLIAEDSYSFIRAGKTSAEDLNEGFYLSSTDLYIGDEETYLKYDLNGLTIAGEINANSGSIGPFHVTENFIYTKYEDSDSVNFILGENGICLGNYGRFYIGNNYINGEDVFEEYAYNGGTIIDSSGGIQTDYLMIMHQGDYKGTRRLDATGIYMNIFQGIYPSSDDDPDDFPLQLQLIGCDSAGNLVDRCYIGLWSEGRLIIGDRDMGVKRSTDPFYYATKASIDGSIFCRKWFLYGYNNEFKEEDDPDQNVVYRLQPYYDKDKKITYAIFKKWGTYEATRSGLPDIEGMNNSNNSDVSTSSDIITFDATVLGGGV